MVTRGRFFLVLALVASGVGALTPRASAASGQADPTFGGDGVVLTDFAGEGRSDRAVSMILDGEKVLIGGTRFDGARTLPFVARYLANGTLDPAFGTGGIATVPIPSDTSFHLGRLVRYPNGNLLLAGTAFQTGGVLRTAVAYMNPAGQSLDLYKSHNQVDNYDAVAVANFDSTGIVATAAQAAQGSATRHIVVERFISQNLQTNFGTNGRVTIDIGSGSDEPADIALTPTNAIMVLGRCERRVSETAVNYDMCLARLTQSGALDTAFSGDGKMLFDHDGGWDRAQKLVVQPDGKLLVITQDYVARFLANGDTDNSFGDGGVSELAGFVAKQGTLEASGHILLAGENSGLATMRLSANGTHDINYGRPLIPKLGTYDWVRGMGQDVNGRTLVAGGHYSNGFNTPYDTFVARLSPHGEAPEPSGTDTAGQTVSLTVQAANAPEVEEGVLAIAVEQPTVTFGTWAPGTQATAQLGPISFENNLNTGAAWSASMIACSLVANTNMIDVDYMHLTPGTISPAGATAGSAGNLTIDNPDTCYSSAPRTMMTAPGTSQGTFTQSGSTLRVNIPANQPTGAYQGFIQYTLTG